MVPWLGSAAYVADLERGVRESVSITDGRAVDLTVRDATREEVEERFGRQGAEALTTALATPYAIVTLRERYGFVVDSNAIVAMTLKSERAGA